MSTEPEADVMPKDDEADLQVAATEESPQKASNVKPVAVEADQAHVTEEAIATELWFGSFIIRCPGVLCLIILFVLTIVTIIDAGLFEIAENSNRTFLVETNPYVEAFDAYTLSGQFIADNSDTNVTVPPQTQRDDFWLYSIMFTLDGHNFDKSNPEKSDYWILSKENIETIIKYEDKIVTDPQWKNQFCYAGDTPLSNNYSCTPAISSAARMVYDLHNYSNMSDADIKAYIVDRLDSGFSMFFNPISDDESQTYIYRSFMAAGLPIATEWVTQNGTLEHTTSYANPSDDVIEQERIYLDWATPIFKELTVDPNGDLVDGNLKILAMSGIVYDDYFNIILSESMAYLVFSVLIVMVYMSIHLQSIFLSVTALFQILMSFPLAFFFYRVVIGIPHYDSLSSLIIFVLLGVGADDVFVFTDAWLQSAHFVKDTGLTTPRKPDCRDKYCCSSCVAQNEQRLILRMSFAFRRAAKAMAVTQVTTFCAFLATATSTVMPISAFGIWAALVVAMNYCLVITLYPAILIIHHRYIKPWESKCLCCLCRLCKRTTTQPQPPVDAPQDADGDMMPSISRQFSSDVQPEEYRCFELFLGRTWSALIVRFKIPILALFLIIFITAAVLGIQMEAESKSPPWFSDQHFMQKALEESEQFAASQTDDLVQIHVTFGIEGVDRDGFSFWKPDEYGVVVWDDDFDMSSADSQTYLMTMCDEIKVNDILVYSEDVVECPIVAFEAYLQGIGETFPYVRGSTSDPSFAEMYYAFVSSDAGLESRAAGLTFVESVDGDYAVRFYAMQIVTAITWNADSVESREFRSKWNEVIQEFVDECPEHLCGHVENVALRWCWLETQTAFVRSAIQGILIAMPLAFVVLLLSTRNWIVSVFAVLDIIGIMLCELSIMYLMGWKFGVSECISIVIIIGFSVDYVVHLANAYLESPARGREQRLSFALLTMGISVVSGAITTFAAGFFLIFPALTFFFKMGILMISTVLVSIIWAMCFFTSICALIGPEGDRGDLRKYFRVCCPAKDEEDEGEATQATEPKNGKDNYTNYQVDNNDVKSYGIEMN